MTWWSRQDSHPIVGKYVRVNLIPLHDTPVWLNEQRSSRHGEILAEHPEGVTGVVVKVWQQLINHFDSDEINPRLLAKVAIPDSGAEHIEYSLMTCLEELTNLGEPTDNIRRLIR